GELVTRLILLRDVHAAIVSPEQHVSESVDVAGPIVTAELSRARQTDLEPRQRLEGHAQTEEQGIVDDTLVVESTDKGRQGPGSDPAEPAGTERRRARAADRCLRNRPRIRGQDQTAVPTRAPPALGIAERKRPIAEVHAEIGAVRPERISVCGIPRSRRIDPDSEAVAAEGETSGELRI